MSDKQKKYATWIVALLALLGGGGAGIDAAGYDPTSIDLGALKELGVVGAALLIGYFHLYIRPLLVSANNRLGVLVGAPAPVEEASDAADLVETAPIPRPVAKVGTTTGPLRVIKDPP